jgi:hypothetical protein
VIVPEVVLDRTRAWQWWLGCLVLIGFLTH